MLRVTTKGHFVLAKGSEVAVIKGALEFEEEVRVDPS